MTLASAPATNRPLVLGSTSRYRRELLQRLHIPFEVAAPDVDETPRPGEAPRALAERLALAKARAVAAAFPGAVVIGSDQVADLAGEPLGKPGDPRKRRRAAAPHARAHRDLPDRRGRGLPRKRL
jgi:septum formation protein